MPAGLVEPSLCHESVNFLSHAGLRVLSLALVLPLVPLVLEAQRGGSQMQLGNHSIEIHMVNQNGAPLNVSVRVEVLTAGGMRMAEAYSNREQGVADFEGFSDGVFQLRITAPDIETVTQTFEITATEATHREYVRVELKNLNPGSPASPGTDPTISAEDLSVPAKAREEFAKGMEAEGARFPAGLPAGTGARRRAISELRKGAQQFRSALSENRSEAEGSDRIFQGCAV